MAFYEDTKDGWVPITESAFPVWIEETDDYEGFFRSDSGTSWDLYERNPNSGSISWIVSWGNSSVHQVLLTDPSHVIDLVLKLKMTSLAEKLSDNWLRAYAIAETERVLPEAREHTRLMAAREEQERRERQKHWEQTSQVKTKG